MAEAAPEHLDGHRAARPILLRRVDDAHAAGAERVQHEKGPPRCRAGLQRTVDRRHVERRNAVGIEKLLVGHVERGERATSTSRAQRDVAAAALVEERRRGRAASTFGQRQEDRFGGWQRHGRASAGGSPMRPEHAVQPGARERPFVLDGGRRQIERAGGFFDAQAGEVPQRHDLRFPRIGLLEARERFVDGDEIGRATGSTRMMPLSSSTRSSALPCLMR